MEEVEIPLWIPLERAAMDPKGNVVLWIRDICNTLAALTLKGSVT